MYKCEECIYFINCKKKNISKCNNFEYNFELVQIGIKIFKNKKYKSKENTKKYTQIKINDIS